MIERCAGRLQATDTAKKRLFLTRLGEADVPPGGIPAGTQSLLGEADEILDARAKSFG
ncbi:MAG: hypothetical protein PHI18_06670 [bacterium]|nr:hypothetical protein [bacterium]